MRKLLAVIGFNPTSFELEDDQDEDESNTEKPDTKQGDRPVMAKKVAPAKAPVTEKVSGIKFLQNGTRPKSVPK